MNLAQLRHLIAVADTGSFSRAAEAVHLTQPALSRSIRALEDELGLQLVDRVGKRNELTAAGRDVVERARRIVFEAGELKQVAAQLAGGLAGTLGVGLGSGPGALLQVPLLGHFAARHPRLRLTVSRAPTDLLVQSLRARRLDALVVDLRSVAPAADLAIEALPEMPAGFVCRAGHPLLARPRVRLDDLLAFPIASSPLSDEVARLLVERYGPRANPAEMVTLRCDDIASLIDATLASDAVFLGILAAAREPLGRGAMAVLATEPPLAAGARFAMLTLAGRAEPPALPLLRRFVAATVLDEPAIRPTAARRRSGRS